jgi:hypothetical protein
MALMIKSTYCLFSYFILPIFACQKKTGFSAEEKGVFFCINWVGNKTIWLAGATGKIIDKYSFTGKNMYF